jgi:Flp pilus assembly protein TadD
LSVINNNYALHLKHIAHAYELARLQRYDLALQEVQRALDLDPHSAEAHSCGAWVLRQSGRLDDAEEAARRALSFGPRLAAAYNVLACTLWSKGKLPEAEQSFETAIALQSPDTALYVTNYARMMLARLRPQDALVLANRALVLAPSRSIAHEVRGEALRELGENGEATEALQTALRLDPRNERAHNSLGQAQLAHGDAGKAQDSFREALRLQPGERKVQANLVSALRAQYPLYGRLLAFTMRVNTTKGRVRFLWVSVIGLALMLILPIAGELVYGLNSRIDHDIKNLWMLLMGSVFAMWLLALVGLLIAPTCFDLLLRLDPRNRAVVQFGPADVARVGLRLAAVFSLLAFGVLLVTAGPFDANTHLALYLCMASLSAVFLSGGTRRLDQTIAIYRGVSWGCYVVLVGCLYVIAVGSALYALPRMVWVGVVWLFITSLGVYGTLWVSRELDARQVPLSARRPLIRWLLGIAGFALIGLVTALGLGLDLYFAGLIALGATSVGCVAAAATRRTVRNVRLYRQWVMANGEVDAQSRIVLVVMSACACLAAIALAFHYFSAK